jgi:hypothetical protein
MATKKSTTERPISRARGKIKLSARYQAMGNPKICTNARLDVVSQVVSIPTSRGYKLAKRWLVTIDLQDPIDGQWVPIIFISQASSEKLAKKRAMKGLEKWSKWLSASLDGDES